MGRISLLLALTVMVVPACGREAPEPPPGSRQITIPTPDGVQLDAIEVGSGTDVAVLSHGATGTMTGFYRLAEALAADGWRVIAYDARGVGESTGGPDEDRETDLRAVVAYARDTEAGSILLGGASLGASLSISMAAELEADALVSLSAPAGSFGADRTADDLADAIPVLVAAAQDNEPYTSDARALAEAFGVEPVIVGGDGHGTGMFGENPDLIEQIVTFADGTR